MVNDTGESASCYFHTIDVKIIRASILCSLTVRHCRIMQRTLIAWVGTSVMRDSNCYNVRARAPISIVGSIGNVIYSAIVFTTPFGTYLCCGSSHA